MFCSQRTVNVRVCHLSHHPSLPPEPRLQNSKLYHKSQVFFVVFFTVRELRQRNIAWGCFISPQLWLLALCTPLHLVFLIIRLFAPSLRISETNSLSSPTVLIFSDPLRQLCEHPAFFFSSSPRASFSFPSPFPSLYFSFPSLCLSLQVLSGIFRVLSLTVRPGSIQMKR